MILSVRLVAFYALIAGIMASPLVNYSALGIASYQGDARLIIWTLAWDNHALITRTPLFDSNIFFPTPNSLGYNEHLFGLSLFTLPIYAITRNPVLAYNLVWLCSFVLNALSAHALLKRYTHNDLSAIAGAITYAFSFYVMLHAHGHLHLVWTWLLPVSVLCLTRWSEQPTLLRALLWALGVALICITSWYLAVFAAMIQGFALLTVIPQLWRRKQLRKLHQIAIGSLLIGCIVWPFIRPYKDLPMPQRQEIVANAADLAAYIVPPANTWVGRLWVRRLGEGPRWIWGEQTLFTGWIALALAAFGVFELVRRRTWNPLIPLGGMIVLAFMLSLGPQATERSWSVFDAAAALPGMQGFRAPARFANVVLFGVSILTAFGAAFIQGQHRLGGRIVVGLLPIMLSEWFVVSFPAGKPRPFAVPPIYRTEQIGRSRALVSLPDYSSTPEWYIGADYLYFSTVHWRPIVNGFGRAEPPGHRRVISHMNAFPGPNNARTMRELGIEHVVLHGDRYPDNGNDLVQGALETGEYDLVSRAGSDYLFRVRGTALR